jgi:hypothetical protein
MNDTIFIPRKDAILALDLVASSVQNGLDEGISLSNNNSYLRLKNLYTFNGVKSRFADKVLQASLDEGKRQMMTRQPTHIRFMSTKEKDSSVLRHNPN